jgi:DNA (cytosine-5)-methyltransferase 1
VEVKIIGQMDNTIDHTFESANRVYDKNGLSPTINTCGGGGLQSKIIIEPKCLNSKGGRGGEIGLQPSVQDRVYSTDAVSTAVTTSYMPSILEEKPVIIEDTQGFEGEPKIYNDCSPTLRSERSGLKTIVAMRGRNPENPSDRTAGSPTEQRLEPNSQGICTTLTSVQKDNLVLENVYDFYNDKMKEDGVCGTITGACSHNGSGTFGIAETVKVKQATKDGYIECKVGGVADLSFPDSATRRGRVQDMGDTCPTLMAGESDICRIESRYRIRKLTPLECWRLMGFKDEDFLSAKLGSRDIAKEILLTYLHLGKRMFTEVERIEKMSNTQLYKQAGNSIAEPVLVAIFGQMIPGKENVYREL